MRDAVALGAQREGMSFRRSSARDSEEGMSAISARTAAMVQRPFEVPVPFVEEWSEASARERRALMTDLTA